jgi:hypothetical protein
MTSPSENETIPDSYGSLDSERVIETIRRLEQRIIERFPNSGLSRVCGELLKTAQRSKERISWMERPHYGLRITTLLIIGLILLVLIQGILSMSAPAERYQPEFDVRTKVSGCNCFSHEARVI